MTTPVSTADRVAEMLRQNPNLTPGIIQKELHVTRNTASTTLARIRRRLRAGKSATASPGQAEGSETKESVSTDFKADTGCLESRSARIKTPDQLIKECKIDLSVWEVERVQCNKWEVGRAQKAVDLRWVAGRADGFVRDTGRVFVEPLFQVKVWLVKKGAKKPAQALKDALSELTKDIRGLGPVKPIRYPRVKDGHLLEISIPDLHIGKLCWSKETGQPDYDTSIAKAELRSAVETLVGYTRGFPISRILYPIGNDFFNVDNDQKTTLGGTPQDEDGRWQKSFKEGVTIQIETILKLARISPVDVLICQGNHDWQRVFYLGEVLGAYFHDTPGITVDNSPRARMYYRWEKNLIGFTHGSEEKPITLPGLMAQEAPKEWYQTKFREWHLGHVHHKRDKLFEPLAEENGVRLRYIPSLSPADSWHAKRGYISLRAAEAFLWHPTRGCISNFSHHP